MTRRSWMAATALCLAVVTAATGPAPRDAIAGILAMTRVPGASWARESGPVTFRAAADAERLLDAESSARYPMWMIVLLAIILLLIWLIYHTWTGWKPVFRGG
ncbi:MAG: hypothetical protein ACM3OG_02835 [Actinomycetota bacterium]